MIVQEFLRWEWFPIEIEEDEDVSEEDEKLENKKESEEDDKSKEKKKFTTILQRYRKYLIKKEEEEMKQKERDDIERKEREQKEQEENEERERNEEKEKNEEEDEKSREEEKVVEVEKLEEEEKVVEENKSTNEKIPNKEREIIEEEKSIEEDKPHEGETIDKEEKPTEGKEGEEKDPHEGEELIYPEIEKLNEKLLPVDEEGNALSEDLDAKELVERLMNHAEITRLWKEEYDKTKGISKYSRIVIIPKNGENVEVEGIEIIPATEKMLIASTWPLACYLLIKKIAMRRFSTSLVEFEAIENYRIGIFDRQELFIRMDYRFSNELEDARAARAEDYNDYLNDEKLIQQDKDNSILLAKQMEDKLKADCATLEAQELKVYNNENGPVSAENEKMWETLFELQNKDRDKELQQRGKKGQSIEEVEDLMWVFEDDIKRKNIELLEQTVCLVSFTIKLYDLEV
ncbi:hypothetical protein M758_1G295600 [Ceratodon purpureus]|nr:hypothetical protein M758_1G295600 [Ceratodon purpureus]